MGVNEGSLTIDDVDIASLKLKDLRRSLSIIPQVSCKLSLICPLFAKVYPAKNLKPRNHINFDLWSDTEVGLNLTLHFVERHKSFGQVINQDSEPKP